MRVPTRDKQITITAAFGDINKNIWTTWHHGIDFVNFTNDDIYCAIGGKVSYIDYDPTGWGWYVSIRADDGLFHIYAHMAHRSNLVVGESIKEGDFVGKMGSTGHSTGKHLHYEIRDDAKNSINPAPFLGIKNERGVQMNTYDWAREYYDYLVNMGIIDAEQQFEKWLNFSGPVCELRIGELLAILAKTAGYRPNA